VRGLGARRHSATATGSPPRPPHRKTTGQKGTKDPRHGGVDPRRQLRFSGEEALRTGAGGGGGGGGGEGTGMADRHDLRAWEW
jgi:hypothetical protein